MRRNNKNLIITGKHLKKIPWFVKITLVILFVGIQQIKATDSYNQKARLSLEVEAKSLTEVFTLIEKNSEFLFNYLDVDVAGVKVDVNVKNGNIRDVLNQALRNTDLTYSINNRHITIINSKWAKESNPVLDARQVPEGQITISGIVTDEGSESLIGVAVMEKGGCVSILDVTCGL